VSRGSAVAGGHSSGRSAKAFFMLLYQPIDVFGCRQLPFIASRAAWWDASPAFSASLRVAVLGLDQLVGALAAVRELAWSA
jgi:hypothetical protein